MGHFLDELPLDFTSAGVQDLLHILADNYPGKSDVQGLARNAGIPLATVDWDGSMILVWPRVLSTARGQGRLRTLLDLVIHAPDAAVGDRVRELVAEAPVLAAPEPVVDLQWKVEGMTQDGLERQIESQPTLLDISFLERGLELAPAVSRLLVSMSGQDYYGTAFRIGEDMLLTNHHVLFDQCGPATKTVAWFGYERTFEGGERAHTEIACRPDSIVGNADHDWAVIRAEDPLPATIPVIALTGAPAPKTLDRVYIIQHPAGGVKKIGMVHNVITHVTDDIVQYRADTEGGSSGSPVFNERWQLVALHHRWGSQVRAGRTEYYNQGRRIERVASGLAAAGLV